ncbi:MAG: tyrosine-type recombinase/integrase [Beijerinckiaceae bacterium]
MAREINKLSARKVATVVEAGRHGDGNGLYLYVDKSGARRWLFLFRWGGKLKEMGLGSASSVSLADARSRASVARAVLSSGQNPIIERRAANDRRNTVPSFGSFTASLLPDICSGFRNEKHREQWASTLRTYAAPLNDLPVNIVTTAHVLEALNPIWHSRPETASRVRGRIERVLDAAKAKGFIEHPWENPARWRGHLSNLLPRRPALSRGHHAAMPYMDVSGFLQDLRSRHSTAARALELTVLCASRSGETLGATWDEFDLAAGIWTLPARRMKAGRQHRVPLSPAALSLLKQHSAARTGDYVFPGLKAGRPLSNMAMEMQLRRMKLSHYTVHGFRSSFRDWAGETTVFPREIAEQALAHVVGDQTERAYRRGDALERRRELMNAWATFLGRGD